MYAWPLGARIFPRLCNSLFVTAMPSFPPSSARSSHVWSSADSGTVGTNGDGTYGGLKMSRSTDAGLRLDVRSPWMESKFTVAAFFAFVAIAAWQQCGFISVAIRNAFFSICWFRNVDTIPEPVPSSTTSRGLLLATVAPISSNRSRSKKESSAGSYILS
ncbi:hypothetical protein KL905_000088 [Ogataea polymorpha]|uniref:Uncharacterized protein n=1 Tax=Ogataea polymorpha TaxID=460523 RepID=A0A9P8P159_9ASCO|nr:hypothetical protein KL937_000990 [Ogataea polymorpha]KAG7891497.1 hypothetical protein KL936_001440 [Ogataea polymorpha]KAG7894851.1 hypothetical protein KL908_001201 [Ogataea polymorpha]KAG7902667.1 hypothetical protein KL935_001575 [Ogataea polymorpha]KAG7911345.1 hypothetical protein KL906_000666 [Ogataea polymorpha]